MKYPAIQLKTTVTLPPALAEIAHKISTEQHWTFCQAVVFFVKRGAKAQENAQHAVTDSYERFMNADTATKQKAGDDLIQAIFGPESLA